MADSSGFPVIPRLTEVFNKSTELINLTVRIRTRKQTPRVSSIGYDVHRLPSNSAHGLGTLADAWGRRLMFIACLVLLSISCVGLALVPTHAYWLLLLLRCFQAAGSASTIALGAGVIGDISEPKERGGFLGMYSIGPLVGPAIGPVLGGALTEGLLGWRSICWLLCIASAACAVVLILLLPETLRAIVGSGSVVPAKILRPVLPHIGRGRREQISEPYPTPSLSRQARPRFRNPLRLLLNLDILLLLLFNGIVCAIMYGVNASVATSFHSVYPELGQTELGLCFLAIGCGMLIGASASGRVLDWDYQCVKKSVCTEGLEQDADSFPIEKARMRLMPGLVAVYIAVCVAYGWSLEEKVHIAAALVFMFGVGAIALAIMNATQTLLLDLVPAQASFVTACMQNNLVRCALSAITIAVIQLIINAMGVGWTYVLLAGICVLVSPLMVVVRKIGPEWRKRRRGASALAGEVVAN
ncbi:MFS domain-containing protein [Mycena kentingensis (nom. inval.)]|nr:MFS domain-containing protein [Mycena kentingensis (nom. inval.)]